jgi:hypothetical protein
MIVEARVFSVILVTMVAFVGCGSDAKSESGGASGTGGAGGSGGGPAASSHEPVAYNGDCSSAKWANVTDECWACLCGACKTTLDACNKDCTDILECAEEKHALVNVTADLNCELRATGNLCLQTPAAQAATQALITFDGCLLNGATERVAGEFRACDTVCKTPYSGDVCQRFPAM